MDGAVRGGRAMAVRREHLEVDRAHGELERVRPSDRCREDAHHPGQQHRERIRWRAGRGKRQTPVRRLGEIGELPAHREGDVPRHHVEAVVRGDGGVPVGVLDPGGVPLVVDPLAPRGGTLPEVFERRGRGLARADREAGVVGGAALPDHPVRGPRRGAARQDDHPGGVAPRGQVAVVPRSKLAAVGMHAVGSQLGLQVRLEAVGRRDDRAEPDRIRQHLGIQRVREHAVLRRTPRSVATVRRRGPRPRHRTRPVVQRVPRHVDQHRVALAQVALAPSGRRLEGAGAAAGAVGDALRRREAAPGVGVPLWAVPPRHCRPR
mmetsp:Transcript_33972/g.89131  ORF Transcript_33972/g.89131 Transcript_33972/m.89131 type:complete len:320 (+) Transcript_33972:172-1131(+)